LASRQKAQHGAVISYTDSCGADTPVRLPLLASRGHAANLGNQRLFG